MNDPKVSIIVPVYNVEEYLTTCVESLIHQTYQNIEIILVDDGSPDQSPKICDDYGLKDERVKVVHKENGGLSDARNTGLEVISGEYVLFLDSDDFLNNKAIELLVHKMLDSDSDVVVFGYYADFLDHNELVYSVKKVPGVEATYENSTFDSITFNAHFVGLLGYAWNKLYKASLIKDSDIRFSKGISLVEDVLFNGPLLTKAKKVSFIKDMFVHYIQRDRQTLGARLYDNHLELKVMAITKMEALLHHWNVKEETISILSGQTMYNTIIEITRLLSKSVKYDRKTKHQKLMNVLNDFRTENYLDKCHPKGYKNKILLSLMKRKQAKILLRLYK